MLNLAPQTWTPVECARCHYHGYVLTGPTVNPWLCIDCRLLAKFDAIENDDQLDLFAGTSTH